MKKQIVLLLCAFLLTSCSFLRPRNTSELSIFSEEATSSSEINSATSDNNSLTSATSDTSFEDYSEQSSEIITENTSEESSYITPSYTESTEESADETSSEISEEESEDLSETESISDEDMSSTSEEESNEESSFEEESVVSLVYFPKTIYDIKVGKYEYLTVDFNPSDVDLDYKEGVWSSLDESVATVSQYGKVTGVKEGSTVITFTTNKEGVTGACTVYVWNSLDDITREYQRVNNPDDIKVGDEIILASPDFGVAASINIYSGYVTTSNCSFSSDKSRITSYAEDVSSFYIHPSEYDDAFCLENQNNAFLAGRETQTGNHLSYSENGKAQIDWIFEIPDGYSEIFCVNYNIQNDYWLMFNRINNDDIRFNLYDSNETALMKKPIVYRNTVVR